LKKTGNVPVPLFAAERVDFAMQWDALMHGKLVGQMVMIEPELNFVDSGSDADAQTGAGGPWLAIIRDLFPFKINSARVRNGQTDRTRPLCAYPQVATYKGSGSTDESANFVCK